MGVTKMQYMQKKWRRCQRTSDFQLYLHNLKDFVRIEMPVITEICKIQQHVKLRKTDL